MSALAVVEFVLVVLGAILVIDGINRAAKALETLARTAEADEKRRLELEASLREVRR